MNRPFFSIYLESVQMADISNRMLDEELQREDEDPVLLNALADLVKTNTNFMSICQKRALDEKQG